MGAPRYHSSVDSSFLRDAHAELHRGCENHMSPRDLDYLHNELEHMALSRCSRDELRRFVDCKTGRASPREYRDLQEQASRSAMERMRHSPMSHISDSMQYMVDAPVKPFKIPSGGPKVNKKLLLV